MWAGDCVSAVAPVVESGSGVEGADADVATDGASGDGAGKKPKRPVAARR